jgi:hypothetical protein
LTARLEKTKLSEEMVEDDLSRVEKRRFEYARNSYHGEFIDFLHRSYSRVPPCSYSHASPHTSRVLSRFSYGSNHHSYGFGS